MKKPTGRPPVEGDKRTNLVAFYLTVNDHRLLKMAADKGGFKSTSSLVTALVEPIIRGGFSLRASVRAIGQIQRFMEANGVKFKASMADVKEGLLNLVFSTPPPIISDEIEDLSQLISDLRRVADELENQTNNPQPTNV